MSDTKRFIPVSALSARLEKVRGKIDSLGHQIEELKREEKILVSLLSEAVDEESVETKSSGSSSAEPRSRAKGVVEAIMELVQSRPGITRDGLVEGLKYLNVNPFNAIAARRTIFNNLGNQIRSGKVVESTDGGLFIAGATSVAG